MTRESKESVLSRWSRRKREADQVETAPQPAAASGEPDEQALEADQKPPLTDADMPDIETLTEESDFTGFMSAGVSDELRNLALRKLFRAPVFNIRDGLDEYDEDYTSFEKLGDIVTSDMKHRIEMEAQELREKLAAEAEAEAKTEAGVETAEGEAETLEADDDDGKDKDVQAAPETLVALDSTTDPDLEDEQ